ncbi:MAG TPA: arsenate reductase (glutaredoxin) [Saprospiraceae bacterium]|jgi:arsenate reductase|nr:arsenate reductase (glutaredoxin) [Saprospiraceae bacterium]MCC6689828.1 arsenate reductase (glutaredoxin) [Saprospiraceae bacterium]HMV24182.1 arsenate reductase (glutaredoxin) [Saprospiraceae bacterium]HMW74399.1 arsenate reductase (glutaredoxin) [Saprospiraceae bacterium]HMX84173.1 arsenate reductase (glutaredoxin) [Saprospiraceae bacterium]
MQIFYNPRCGKCRNAKNFLEDQNISCDIFEYLSETFTEETLDEIVRKSGLDVTDFIRKKEDLYKEKFAQKEYSHDEWLDILVENPSLLERPIIITEDRAWIARSDEKLQEVLQQYND